MAEVLYSLIAAGSSTSSPPDGFACLSSEGALIAAYVSNPDDPDDVLLDASASDVLQESIVRGRRVAVLVCEVLGYDFNSNTGKWDVALSYATGALIDSERPLLPCDICQIDCLDCKTQAKLAGGYTGEVDQTWITNYDGYLNENSDLGNGGLPVLDP